MSKFADSQRSSDEAMYRRMIRGSKFSNNQRAIVQCLVNLWFHHQGAPIHPGRQKIARIANVSVPTVSRTLQFLVGLAVLTPVAFNKGGAGVATKYVVDLRQLAEMCGHFLPVELPGHLVLKNAAEPYQTEPDHTPEKPYQNDSLYSHTVATPLFVCLGTDSYRQSFRSQVGESSSDTAVNLLLLEWADMDSASWGHA